MLPLDVSAWRGLGCSHLVYGWAVINGDRSLSTPTTNDVMLDSAYPNYVRVTALQKGQPQVKVLNAINFQFSIINSLFRFCSVYGKLATAATSKVSIRVGWWQSDW